jgi:hypothetical protein
MRRDRLHVSDNIISFPVRDLLQLLDVPPRDWQHSLRRDQQRLNQDLQPGSDLGTA